LRFVQNGLEAPVLGSTVIVCDNYMKNKVSSMMTMSSVAGVIQDVYEEEMRKGRVAQTAEEIPRAYDEITERWLTDALCKGVPGAQVVSHRFGEPDNGSSNRRSLVVEYNQAGKEAALNTRFFCKAWQNLNVRIMNAISNTLNAEIVFYRHVRPELDIEAPECHFANLDTTSFNGIIILGDISDRVEGFCSHDTPMNKARVESQLEILGRLHARYYQSKKLGAELEGFGTWPEFFHRTRLYGLEESSNNGFLAAQDVISPRLYKHSASIWEKTVTSVDMHNDLPHTVVHSDVHLRNWYLVSGDTMGLSDWGCCTKGHWGRDLAYLLGTACTVEDRRVWQDDLIRYYLSILAENGGPAVSFDEAFTHYRQQLFNALAWWTITYTPTPGMADMQPRESSLEFIRRIAAAMDDVDSIASL